MLPVPSPSYVLGLDLLTPQDLYIEPVREVEGELVYDFDNPQRPNIIHRTINEAAILLYSLVPSETNQARWELGVSYWTLAKLYLKLAREVGRNIGHVSGRTGQVNVPMGAHQANREAADDFYRQLRALYPEVDFPSLDNSSGGAVIVRRR